MRKQKSGQSTKAFAGILATPLPVPSFGLLSTDEDMAAAFSELEAEENRRMLALLEHYRIPAIGIGDDHWHRLCLELARQYIDAFKPPGPKRGAKSRWGYFERAILWVEVKRLKCGERTTIECCSVLEAQEPWQSLVRRKEMTNQGESYDPGEALYRQWLKADVRWCRIAWEAYLYDRGGWDSVLDGVLGADIRR